MMVYLLKRLASSLAILCSLCAVNTDAKDNNKKLFISFFPPTTDIEDGSSVEILMNVANMLPDEVIGGKDLYLNVTVESSGVHINCSEFTSSCGNISVPADESVKTVRLNVTVPPFSKDDPIKVDSPLIFKVKLFEEGSNKPLDGHYVHVEDSITIVDHRCMEVGFTDQPYITSDNTNITLHLMNYNEDIVSNELPVQVNVTLSLKGKEVNSILVVWHSQSSGVKDVTFVNLTDSDEFYIATVNTNTTTPHVKIVNKTVTIFLKRDITELFQSLFHDAMSSVQGEITRLRRELETEYVRIDNTSDTTPTASSASPIPSSDSPSPIPSSDSPSHIPSSDSPSPIPSSDSPSPIPSSDSPSPSSDPVTDVDEVTTVGDVDEVTTVGDVSDVDNDGDVDDDVDDVDDAVASPDDRIGGFTWFIFIGFISLLILGVSGYVLYSNRIKVKEFISSKMTSVASSSTPTGKSGRGRKYTPLPSSIHETLVHED